MDGSMRGSNDTALDTISAAATIIASSENRAPQASVQKRKWGSFWSAYWCFGSHQHKKRIGHAVLVTETTSSATESSASRIPSQPPPLVVPFIAPPSSPASFIQSEPQSSVQSPVGLLSFNSMSACMYSPGPANIFAVGPYAYEHQLVSPPVFSTYTTEPSTAPFTPPPESIQFTTPSSPEVPFARLLDPNWETTEAGQRFLSRQYEFQPYQPYTGSPVGQLISPSSGISGSGTSSPFPDREFSPSGAPFLHLQIGIPPKLSSLDRRSPNEWGSQQGSGSLTPDAVGPRYRDSYVLDRQNSDIAPLPKSFCRYRNDENSAHPRVSIEVTAEDIVRCMANEPSLAKAVSHFVETNGIAVSKDDKGETSEQIKNEALADEETERLLQKHRSITLGSAKEFNFGNLDGGSSDTRAAGSEWWVNEKVTGDEGGSCKNWSFPIIQPSFS